MQDIHLHRGELGQTIQGESSMEKLKIGDLVKYPRGINDDSNGILCIVIEIKGNTGQYIVQSIATGEHYVAIDRWLTHPPLYPNQRRQQ